MTDDEARPLPFGVVACSLCEAREAAWVHTLDPERARSRVYGKGHIWASQLRLCDRCHRLLQARDLEGLVAAEPKSAALQDADLDERVGNGLPALLYADRGGVPIDQLRPSGYRELVAEGFTPLENVTGALFLADAWPETDRRALAAVDPEDAQWLHEGQHWFVRSPWPSIPLCDVVGLVLNTFDVVVAESQPRVDDEYAKARVRELLMTPEDVVRRMLGW